LTNPHKFVDLPAGKSDTNSPTQPLSQWRVRAGSAAAKILEKFLIVKIFRFRNGISQINDRNHNSQFIFHLILLKMLQNFYFSFFPFRAHPPGCAYRYRLCYARRSQLSAKGGNRSTNLGGFTLILSSYARTDRNSYMS
jgi:hypothetical protein